MKETVEEEYWNQPLAYWIRDCAIGNPALVDENDWRLVSRRKLPLQFNEICDGVLLSLIFRYIDPTTPEIILNCEAARDSVFKQKQLRTLFNCISRFYRVRLQQLIVTQSPDLSLISRATSIDESIEEVNKLILLLLGCAIQSDKKRKFVDRITKFDQNIQIGLANYIQQLTEGSTIIISASESDKIEVFRHLERVMKERDALVEITTIDHDSDEGSSTTTNSSLNGEISIRKETIYDDRLSESAERQMSLELARTKQEMRHWRQKAEITDEENRQLAMASEEKDAKINQLLNERLKLINDSKQVTDLMDDLQAANMKIEKLQSLESVEKKLREVQDQKEFFESKYLSVNERNRNLEETIAELEKNNEILQYENKDRTDIERDFDRSKSTVKELQDEIRKKSAQIEEMMDEHYQLEHALKEREERISQLESNSPSCTPRHYGSLADQLEDAEKDEVARLRAENRKLRAQTEGAMPDSSIVSIQAELDDLRQKLVAEEKKCAEIRLEAQKMKFEREQVNGTLDRVSIELEQATLQVENMRSERDEAVRGLHEARRKFAQFQTDFGKKIEMESEEKIRQLSFELKESRRKYEMADEQRMELEHQVERGKDEQRRLRFEVDEMAEEKNQLETSMAQVERSRKSIENERNVLREKVEKLEDEVEEMKMKLLNVDNSSKRLEDREKLISELQNKLGDIESEHRTIQQQLELELKKTQRLREDLVTEKSRGAELIGRLRSLCAAVALNGGKMNTENVDDDELVDTIDDILMGALAQAKRESDSLRIQQNIQISELTDLRKDIEKLRRSESVSLIESDDRVRELNQENINLKEQIFLLQEKVRELQVEISAKNTEITHAKNSIEELNRNSTTACANNTEVARLQVSLRNTQLQEELVKQENGELRKQLEEAEKSGNNIRNDLDKLESMHKTLLSDHSRLQHLHNLLTRDYDEIKNESVDIKTKLRNLQRTSPMVVSNLRKIEELQTQLAQEKAAKEKQLRAYADLQNEHGLTRRQMENLRSENEHLMRNRDSMTAELRRVRSNDNGLQWSNLVDDLSKQLQSKDLEIAKLNHKIEALTQLNQTYNEENKNLSRQLEILLTQNKELLNRALHDKDQYHLEMKDFQEQLSSLRRHKEKLEDKIMDQYKTMENKKTGKQPLVKRAAKALSINRRRATSNAGSTTEDSSAYSADEGVSPPLVNGNLEDFDNLVPTCSSSDDHDRVSPRYEQIMPLQETTLQRFTNLRSRGDPIGGSVRLPSSHIPRRPIIHSHTYDHIILNKDEKTISSLPPRAPVRNSSVTSSLRLRPPPPPYHSKNHSVPPPSYNSRNLDNSKSPPLFQPRSASTPKPPMEDDSLALMNDSTIDRPVVAEGEKRDFVRGKDERIDKALSFYENVNNNTSTILNDSEESHEKDKANESTVWYEYGCV